MIEVVARKGNVTKLGIVYISQKLKFMEIENAWNPKFQSNRNLKIVEEGLSGISIDFEV